MGSEMCIRDRVRGSELNGIGGWKSDPWRSGRTGAGRWVRWALVFLVAPSPGAVSLAYWWLGDGVSVESKGFSWGPGTDRRLRRLCRRVLSSFLLDDLIATGGSLFESIFQLRDSLF